MRRVPLVLTCEFLITENNVLLLTLVIFSTTLGLKKLQELLYNRRAIFIEGSKKGYNFRI